MFIKSLTVATLIGLSGIVLSGCVADDGGDGYYGGSGGYISSYPDDGYYGRDRYDRRDRYWRESRRDRDWRDRPRREIGMTEVTVLIAVTGLTGQIGMTTIIQDHAHQS